MKSVLIGLLVSVICGCSSLSFTRGERPFDGVVHATSSLVCSYYWSGHDWQGNSIDRALHERVIPTAGIVVYGIVDLSSSVVGDIIIYPFQLAGGGPPSPDFDEKVHSLLPCGTLQSSLNTIGAL